MSDDFSLLGNDEPYLLRCFDLARLGAGHVSPNPMVGAVLVHEGRIIGEGYHHLHGGPHAEVEAVRAVAPADRELIARSTLYVSLEPCCIHGRTPPCTELILDRKIPRVVVSNLDQTPGVDGRGIAQLRGAGVDVTQGILEEEGDRASCIRNCFVAEKRPYIILKFACSADGFIGQEGKSVWLTNAVSRRLTHKWRSEADAILVGARTARIDNPELTTRLFPGSSPLRLVVDPGGSLPHSLKLFDGKAATRVYTEHPEAFAGLPDVIQAVRAPVGAAFLPFLMEDLAQTGKTSLIVEGGARLLGQFIELGLWDEARVFKAPLHLGSGIPAPKLPGSPAKEYRLLNDRLYVWNRRNPQR